MQSAWQNSGNMCVTGNYNIGIQIHKRLNTLSFELLHQSRKNFVPLFQISREQYLSQ